MILRSGGHCISTLQLCGFVVGLCRQFTATVTVDSVRDDPVHPKHSAAERGRLRSVCCGPCSGISCCWQTDNSSSRRRRSRDALASFEYSGAAELVALSGRQLKKRLGWRRKRVRVTVYIRYTVDVVV